MGQERRSFGSIEGRSGYFRARYVGPDRQRYDAPHLFSERIDAEFWLGKVHRSMSMTPSDALRVMADLSRQISGYTTVRCPSAHA